MGRIEARSPFPGTVMFGANLALEQGTSARRVVRRTSVDLLMGVRRGSASIALISGLEATRVGGQPTGHALKLGVAAGIQGRGTYGSWAASLEVTRTQHTGAGGRAREEMAVGVWVKLTR